MAVSSITPASIIDIEQQIATVTAELEKARVQNFAVAEAAFLAAQKAVGAAQAKVNELSDKSIGASKNRFGRTGSDTYDHQSSF